MARPALTFDERDRQLVRVMARLQAQQRDIAAELGVCEKTLRARFGDDLRSGRAAGELRARVTWMLPCISAPSGATLRR